MVSVGAYPERQISENFSFAMTLTRRAFPLVFQQWHQRQVDHTNLPLKSLLDNNNFGWIEKAGGSDNQ
eukprot:scaffold353_cov185-Amphora_coffeaeformis.AAC.85